MPLTASQVQITASADGTPLLLRHQPAARTGGPVVLVGHGPAVHSGLCLPMMAAFAQAGAQVWAGDLRGHGGSVSARAPLAHLDPATGWERLVEDTLRFARIAFAGVPRDQRVLVGGAISGHLMLDLVARDPGLARHLVMAGPIPHQPGVMRLAAGLMRLRALGRAPGRPDPQFLHHLYGFLRAQLPPGSRNIDTISADPEIIRRVQDDPRGFPTPTLDYWRTVLPGLDGVWRRIGPGDLPADLRVLLLSGPDDPQLRGGRLAPQVLAWFAERGIADASLRLIEGVRANILIDAPRLPVVPSVLDWLAAPAPRPASATPAPAGDDTGGAYATALATLGVTDTEALPALPVLIDLCYAALDDEDRWIELVYRLSLLGEKDDARLDQLLALLQPHWDRAFELRESLRQASTMERIYGEVLDRLGLGVALVSEDLVLRHGTPAYAQALARIFGIDPAAADPIGLTARLLGASPGPGDGPLLHEGRSVGVGFTPAPVRGAAETAGPGGRILVLRAPDDTLPERTHRAGLLSLAYGLTGREADVVVRLVEGLSTAAIARDLAMAEHTVRGHLKQVFDKMGVTSRLELSHRILSGPLGWLTGPPASVIPPPTPLN